MIELRNIQRSWKNFSLEDINLKIENKEIFGLFGPNGAGKTLLLETIAGIWLPQRGNIFINEKDITHLPPEKRNIGFLYQEILLFPHLSVKENICYGLKVRRIPQNEIKKRVQELVEFLRLEKIIFRKNSNLLSGGEKQKVALARVLAVDPEVILLDEPTHSLDEQSRQDFKQLLKEIMRISPKTVIYISHDYEELKDVASCIAIMEKGRIIRIDEIKDIP